MSKCKLKQGMFALKISQLFFQNVACNLFVLEPSSKPDILIQSSH